jgi:hypothetical protein
MTGHGVLAELEEARAGSTGRATGAELAARFPARVPLSSWPVARTSREQVLARVLAAPFALANDLSQQTRRQGVLTVLGWLQAQPGSTWQERWAASGAETVPDWRDLAAAWRARRLGGPVPGQRPPHAAPGLMVLICADVVRPSLSWLAGFAPARRGLGEEMARTRDSAAFAELTAMCQGGHVGSQTRQTALLRIALIMAAKGGDVADVLVGDCLELLEATVQAGVALHGGANSPLFYQLLRARGGFPASAPAALRVFSGRGQPAAAQLIGRYGIQCRPVRDLLVDYLAERQPSLDFSSLNNLAYHLGKLFWRDLETHHPGISSLKLPRDVAAAWKQRVMTRTTTTLTPQGRPVQAAQPRLNGRSILTTVRAFYLDLAEWAEDDPSRWGPWVVRCPVTATDASHKKDRSRRKSRMDQRTRERLPVLPALAAFAGRQQQAATELLSAAQATTPAGLFTAAGQTLRRSVMKTRTTGRIWADAPGTSTGKRRDLTFEEHRAFWTWATVEVLRHTGIRIEELTELSHHSLIQYRLPTTGELVPLLQIAPSKTDTERLLVISPELADVLSTIMSRIRDPGGKVPLVVSYDACERVYNPPMPLLFQWRCRLEDRAMSQNALRDYLDHALAEIGAKDASNRLMRYTFHDFRRIFVTDAIMHGLPPHIAALIVGHRDVNTTMGYKAVYPEETINGHRAFIARRRALRPSEEYRVPSDAEWEEFLGHFERRKLSLGTCGRSYDTGCIHEHACIRCPLLRPDPAGRPRLIQIRDNLTARIAEATARGWAGDVDGLTLSRTAAEHQLDQMDQIAAHRGAAVHLGMPAFSDVAGQTVTTPAPRPAHTRP